MNNKNNQTKNKIYVYFIKNLSKSYAFMTSRKSVPNVLFSGNIKDTNSKVYSKFKRKSKYFATQSR